MQANATSKSNKPQAKNTDEHVCANMSQIAAPPFAHNHTAAYTVDIDFKSAFELERCTIITPLYL